MIRPHLPTISSVRTRVVRRAGASICRLSRHLFIDSVRLTMGASKLSFMIPHDLTQALGRFTGDLAFLLEDFWNQSAWRLEGPEMTVVFVGHRDSLFELMPLFFKEPVTPEPITGPIRFGLGRKARHWLDGDADLVICELSRLYPFRPKARCTFKIPQWVNQQIVFPEDTDDFLSGNRYDGLRNHINRARKNGCAWRFSRSRQDFDYFYQRLYLPFVRSRHGQWAHVAPYPFQWDLWIQGAGGGIVLVTHAGEVIAGAICLVVSDVCYNIESGILDARPDLLAQGINAYLCWAVAQWGREQGARYYNMGGSLGWRCNGAFTWKAKWGTQVIHRKIPYRQLIFAADRVAPSLGARLNEIGFVCCKKGRFYSLLLCGNDEAAANGDQLAGLIKRARKQGLCGICALMPGARLKIFDSESVDRPTARPP